MNSVSVKNELLNYQQWFDFVDNHHELVWKEKAEDVKKSLQTIDNVQGDFRERVLRSLNKIWPT